MRHLVPAAVLLLTGCVTLPPLRPADPAQAIPNEKSAGTAFANGIRIVVHPGAWKGGEDLEQYLTPVEVAIHNGGGRAVQVRPASFSLHVPGGFRYDALSTEEVRRLLGPMRGGWGYAFLPWGPPFYPLGGPYVGWWGWSGYGPSPWLGPVIHYGGPSYGRIPTGALTKGTLEPGGEATILLFFQVPADTLRALALDATLSDASGQRLAELRVPFVREGTRAVAMPLPPAAAEPEAPAQPGSWQTVPPPRPPETTPPPPPQTTPPPPQQPPVDTPVGPPVPLPEGAPRPQ